MIIKKYYISKRLESTWHVKILRESDYEPILSFRFSLSDILLGISGFLFFTIFLTFFIIAFTPLREYLPGYTDPKLRRDVIQLNKTVDSLENRLSQLNMWMQSLQKHFKEIDYHGN